MGKLLLFKRRLLLAICLPICCQIMAQPKAFASLQPERIETGDTTGLIIIVSGINAAPNEVDFSPWASVFPVSNIIRRSDWRKSGVQWTRRFTLIAFDSATLELPPLKVRFGSEKPLETNALTLTVFPTRGGREISDMAKIRDVRREPVSWLDYWPWAAGALMLGLVFLWWWRKNRRNSPAPMVQAAIAPVPVSAAEIALQKLVQLQQKQLWKSGQEKEHYAELSLILREYLESRYRVAALESTTSEILQLLGTTDFPPETRTELKELLERSDLVKYAQSKPEEAVHEAVLIRARELVTPSQVKKTGGNQTPAAKPALVKPGSGKYEPL